MMKAIRSKLAKLFNWVKRTVKHIREKVREVKDISNSVSMSDFESKDPEVIRQKIIDLLNDNLSGPEGFDSLQNLNLE